MATTKNAKASGSEQTVPNMKERILYPLTGEIIEKAEEASWERRKAAAVRHLKEQGKTPQQIQQIMSELE